MPATSAAARSRGKARHALRAAPAARTAACKSEIAEPEPARHGERAARLDELQARANDAAARIEAQQTQQDAGAMPDSYPLQWAGRLAILALPRHVGDGNAGQVREQLLWVINRGAAELIIDMIGTTSCHHEGAVASGAQLRLAVTAGAVRRVLTLNGLDRLIPVLPQAH